MALREITLMLLLSGAPWLSEFTSSSPVNAQYVQQAEQRALNLARTVAIKENGGLGVYRPEKCMFATAAGPNPCLIQANPTGFTYRFVGGAPGWQESDAPPSTETEIRIAPDGRSVLGMIYNGPIR